MDGHTSSPPVSGSHALRQARRRPSSTRSQKGIVTYFPLLLSNLGTVLTISNGSDFNKSSHSRLGFFFVQTACLEGVFSTHNAPSHYASTSLPGSSGSWCTMLLA